jgi:hypothetical protein
MSQKFTVTENHIKLLRRANVSWENSEFGAPAIDCKRPYGNSSVYQDIGEILGIKPQDKLCGEFSDAQTDYMRQVHDETQVALQIFLATGQMSVGNYESEKYTNDWHKVA